MQIAITPTFVFHKQLIKYCIYYNTPTAAAQEKAKGLIFQTFGLQLFIKTWVKGIEVSAVQIFLNGAQCFTEANILKQNAVRISSRL